MKEIIYHIPDFFNLFRLNSFLIENLKNNNKIFFPNLKIGSVYGSFPSAIWNSGRTIFGHDDYDNIKNTIDYFNNHNIPCRFTWTNSQLKETDVYDRYCNLIMQISNNGLNEVLINSPILEEYIRKNYPKFKLISSTTKVIKNEKDLSLELEKDYSLVVLDYNFNNNFTFLKEIEKPEKIEILINAICKEDCPIRFKHYKELSNYQLNFRFSSGFFCEIENNNRETIINRKHYISYKDIVDKYVPLGYNNFKIEGRNNPELFVLRQYLDYFILPEFREEFVFNYLFKYYS